MVWKAVATATGYQIYRTDSAGHGARLVADVNIVTGHTTVAPGVVNIWSQTHTYIPGGGPLTSRDPSTRFQYVDYGEAGTRYYRVRAYNAAGAGPLSPVISGTPVTGPPPTITY